ncbi:MAG: hypothetical protein LDL14_00215, partial [Nitrospira sp.]|nr:hypothetical protein [Nitrospira sp.]
MKTKRRDWYMDWCLKGWRLAIAVTVAVALLSSAPAQAATFTQSGGTQVVDSLVLGTGSGDYDTYDLSGTGSLSAGHEFIGYAGTGVFTQTGGTNTVTGNFYVGTLIGSSGTYNLSSGSLSGTYEHIGHGGTGVFNQTGGTHTVTNGFSLGSGGGSGTYNLSGGSLSVRTVERFGSAGTAVFNQTGGTHTIVSNDLILGDQRGGSGTYHLSGTGSLEVGRNEY